MRKYSILYLVTAIGDFFRFLMLALLLLAFSSLLREPRLNGDNSLDSIVPFLIYIAPLAMFPLMSFFLFFDNSVYRSFVPLYCAGKVLSIFASITWMIFTFSPLMFFTLFRFGAGTQKMLVFFTPFMLLWDILSAAIFCYSTWKTRTT